ncbi:MAG TPA: HD domain-containing phosphohydrolase [Geobacteraceae bacterium]|jgi:putative nucleotidyltransferase with HDIG domain
MTDAVLIVDDNKLILDALKELLREEEVRILAAGDAHEAIALVRQEDVAVVVSDNIMPGMSGLEFLSALSIISPSTIKILMSAYADLPTVLAAINRSEVFRYVLKPWQDEEMRGAVREGLRRYRLVKSIQKEDEDVLRSLAQTIELKDPSTRGHCDRVAVFALMIAEALKIPKDVQRQIKYGSWLHDCGKIGVSEVILNGSGRLSSHDFEIMKQHAFWGADVAAKANLSQVARNIIHYHHERYDGTGYPEGLSGKEIPVEARIVAVADVFDALTNDRPYRKGYPPQEAVRIMEGMQGTTFDPEISGLFFSLLQENGSGGVVGGHTD